MDQCLLSSLNKKHISCFSYNHHLFAKDHIIYDSFFSFAKTSSVDDSYIELLSINKNKMFSFNDKTNIIIEKKDTLNMDRFFLKYKHHLYKNILSLNNVFISDLNLYTDLIEYNSFDSIKIKKERPLIALPTIKLNLTPSIREIRILNFLSFLNKACFDTEISFLFGIYFKDIKTQKEFFVINKIDFLKYSFISDLLMSPSYFKQIISLTFDYSLSSKQYIKEII